MLEIAIMLEGQNGLNWSRWQNIVRLVEDLGFVGRGESGPFVSETKKGPDSGIIYISIDPFEWFEGLQSFGHHRSKITGMPDLITMLKMTEDSLIQEAMCV